MTTSGLTTGGRGRGGMTTTTCEGGRKGGGMTTGGLTTGAGGRGGG